MPVKISFVNPSVYQYVLRMSYFFQQGKLTEKKKYSKFQNLATPQDLSTCYWSDASEAMTNMYIQINHLFSWSCWGGGIIDFFFILKIRNAEESFPM